MNLYERDYIKSKITGEEQATANKVYEKNNYEGKAGKFIKEKFIDPFDTCINYNLLPEVIRRKKSLFPNNHIELIDWKNSGKIPQLNNEFLSLIHDGETTEQNILNFINKRPAHYIVATILGSYNLTYHTKKIYVFPEFSIGDGKYRADYLLIGNNSGGYEFVFVELESPSKSTLKDGEDSIVERKGEKQLRDWESELEANFSSFTEELKKHTDKELPNEMLVYDSTRFHYAVVAGLRKDYNDITYKNRRRKNKKENIKQFHYDNLYDRAKDLEGEKSCF